MSKATLEFELPAEQEEFEDACRATTVLINLGNFDNWLRSKVKYENQEMISIDEVRTHIGRAIRDDEYEF